MADTATKPLPPVQISAEDLMKALREQPVAMAEAQQKIDRERAAARAAEFDSWRHIKRLKGVASVNSYLHQEDTGLPDEKRPDLPKIKTVLRCVVTLDSGKEITAEAHAHAFLDKLITERVHAALGVMAVPPERKPWVPLAKELAGHV